MVGEKYSLNLSPRYAPEWGAWEVAREIVCNAMDAAPKDMQIVPVGADCLMVTTPTVPSVAELFVIGEGSKAIGGDTIGQFGEGLKLAALVATRSGGSLTLDLPGKSVTFGFEKVLGVDVLHASVESHPSVSGGYTATIKMPGIAFASAGKFLEDRAAGPRPKSGDKYVKVYCKGVFISNLDVEALWDWNLNDLTINRDRSMVRTWNVASGVGRWMEEHLTEEMAERIIGHQMMLECTKAIESYTDGKCELLAKAWRKKHGEKAVIRETGSEVNRIAREAGYVDVAVVSSELENLLSIYGVRWASEVVPSDYDLEPVDPDKYLGQIATLRRLDPIVKAPHVKVCVYSNRSDDEYGRAERSENRVWLSEQVFAPGNEQTMVMTYLHELAHVMSGHGDETREFEFALTQMLGRLGVAALSQLDAPEEGN